MADWTSARFATRSTPLSPWPPILPPKPPPGGQALPTMRSKRFPPVGLHLRLDVGDDAEVDAAVRLRAGAEVRQQDGAVQVIRPLQLEEEWHHVSARRSAGSRLWKAVH